MKVRRYFASSMRNALDLVRQEQGPDVLILSNRKVDDGVELITADGEIDDALVQQFVDRAKAAPTDRKREPIFEELLDDFVDTSPTDRADTSQLLQGANGAALWNDGETVHRMQQELSDLRGLLEQQLSGLAWSSVKQSHPTRARLMRAFARAGIAPRLAREIALTIPDTAEFSDGWRAGLDQLESRIEILDDPILSNGGFVLLGGPTGVGKTLLACKLAAQFAMKHGARSVALVSTDEQRLGAHQQLKVFGNLLEIPVHTARTADELLGELAALDNTPLVLIDTAGTAPDDFQLREFMIRLAGSGKRSASYLVLSAGTDYHALGRTLTATEDMPYQGCILTKLDEAVVLGPALSAVIEAELPIAYLSAGQNVPDDLEIPIARQLVDKAIATAEDEPLDDDDAVIEQAFTS